MQKARIVSTGKYIPPNTVNVQDIKERERITDSQIQRMKIGTVHYSNPDQLPTDMAIEACRDAFGKCSVTPDDIGLVIYSYGFIPDYLVYPDHSKLQYELGIENATSFTVKQGCNGLLEAIEISKALLETGQYKNILIAASDKGHPVFGNRWHATSYCVSGEGAAAAILSYAEEGIEVLASHSITDGFFSNINYVEFGIAAPPDTDNFDMRKLRFDTTPQGIKFWEEKGGSPMEFLPRYMDRQKQSMLACLERAGLTLQDVDYISDYNMSYEVNKMLFEYMGFPIEKTAIDMHEEYGHMGPPDVIFNLDVALEEKKVKKGDHVLLTSAGSGLTWGNVLLKI